MSRLIYLAPLLLFVPVYLALVLGGAWAWVLPVMIWGVVPLADQLHRGSTENLSEAGEAQVADDPFYTWVLYAALPLQLVALGAYLVQVSGGQLVGHELVGLTLSVGMLCGGVGINVGHELGHRREPLSQHVAQALLTTSLYNHFFIEHNRGHHRRVATPEDPASARRGESVYTFWLRTVPGGWRSAWELENTRLERLGRPWWSWESQMVRLQAVQVAAVTLVLVALGPVALAGWLVASLVGALLLETVNYLEHYGLERERSAHGGYERVQPHHSWNSNRPFGRLLLFDLTRHSDHHAHATRPYQVLRHFEQAPQLPFGYTGGILLALVPPLFQRAMDRALAEWQESRAHDVAA
jgi:alkane 1-monooxygenase